MPRTDLGDLRVIPQSDGYRLQLIRRGIVIEQATGADLTLAWQALGDRVARRLGLVVR